MLADRVIADIQALTVTQGQGVGLPFSVLKWESRFLRGALRAGVRNSALTVGRGNGKTSLVAGIAVSALTGALVVPRGECTVVASSFDQSRITFEHVLAFLQPEIEADSKRFRIQDSANRAIIQCRRTGARIRCLGSDPRRAHGLASALVLADEGAQWEPGKSERMVAALRTGLGKVSNSRLIALGTRPADATHWFSVMLDGGADFALTYAARDTDAPNQRRTWKRANPSLDFMPDLESTIRAEAADASRDPVQLASFRALRLNQGTSDVLESVLVDAGTWDRIEGDVPAEGRKAWGIDLGSGAAMSAIASYWPETGRLDGFACFPELPGLGERGLADGVGGLYQLMADRGELIQAGRRVSDVRALLGEGLKRYGRPDVIVVDRWREAELRQELEAVGFPDSNLIVRGMGFMDGGEDVRTFRASCLTPGAVVPVKSLLMRSAMSEARTVSDAAGNSKLSKGSEGRRRMRARDDVAAAGILAVAEGTRRHKTATPRVRYAVV